MGWDSNPRAALPRPPDFKSGAFNRSATHPAFNREPSQVWLRLLAWIAPSTGATSRTSNLAATDSRFNLRLVKRDAGDRFTAPILL